MLLQNARGCTVACELHNMCVSCGIHPLPEHAFRLCQELNGTKLWPETLHFFQNGSNVSSTVAEAQ